MIGTLHTSRYTAYSNPKELWDPFAADTFTEEYLGCSIIVELVSPEFVKAYVLDPNGKPIGEISVTDGTLGTIIQLGKSLVDQTVEGDV